jgi:hypothetical protein
VSSLARGLCRPQPRSLTVCLRRRAADVLDLRRAQFADGAASARPTPHLTRRKLCLDQRAKRSRLSSVWHAEQAAIQHISRAKPHVVEARDSLCKPQRERDQVQAKLFSVLLDQRRHNRLELCKLGILRRRPVVFEQAAGVVRVGVETPVREADSALADVRGKCVEPLLVGLGF